MTLRNELARAIAISIDSRMGSLDPENNEPATQDYELADDLLARFDVSIRLDARPEVEK